MLAFRARRFNTASAKQGIDVEHLDVVAFYDKPFVKFERLLETYIANAPKGFRSFLSAMPVWIKEKLYLKSLLRKELKQLGGCARNQLPQLLFAEHHQSHAASAFLSESFRRGSSSLYGWCGRVGDHDGLAG